MKKHYKEYDKIFIAETDIATIKILTSYRYDEIPTGIDGFFGAYLVDNQAIIGEHYKNILTIDETYFLIIADEYSMNQKFEFDNKKTIKIYNAGNFGYIIQIIDMIQ